MKNNRSWENSSAIKARNRPTRYLFVYGSLRHGGKAPLNALFHRKTHWIGKARTRGALYRVTRNYPGFVPDHRAGWVTGDLFDISDRQGLLAMLDRYEECTPDFHEPHEYQRQRVRVRTRSHVMEVWTYVYTWPVTGLRRIGTGDFLY